MTASDLEIKIIQKINYIAGKMIEEGVSVSLALYIANYANSEELSGDKKDKIFSLMNEWQDQKNSGIKKEILSKLTSIIENRRQQILSPKF